MKKIFRVVCVGFLFVLLSISAFAVDNIPMSPNIEMITNVYFDVGIDTTTNNSLNKQSQLKIAPDGIVHNNSLYPYCYTFRNETFNLDALPTPSELGVYRNGYHFIKWIYSPTQMKEALERTYSRKLTPYITLQQEAAIDIKVSAVWEKNEATVYYNANGGSVDKDSDFIINEKNYILNKADKKLLHQDFIYNEPHKYGLYNAETMTLQKDGFIFVGWATTPNRTPNILDENDNTITAETFNENMLNKTKSGITLYAQWLPETTNIVYVVDDDVEITNWNYTAKDGFIKKRFALNFYTQKYNFEKDNFVILNNNIFGLSKKRAEFIGWSTKPNGDGIFLKPNRKIDYKTIFSEISDESKVFKLYPVWKEYTLPLPTDVGASITSYWGYRIHPISGTKRFHAGLDIGAGMGTEIYASNSGKVVKVDTIGKSGYGKYVLLEHWDGTQTRYAHACKILVKEGDTVQRGQTIALVGSTGASTGPHLHFEIIINGTTVDPMNYVDFSDIPISGGLKKEKEEEREFLKKQEEQMKKEKNKAAQ